MKKILALDLGMDTGFAVTESHGMNSGTARFKMKPHCEGGSYRNFESWIAGIMQYCRPDEIAYEEAEGRWVNVFAQTYYYSFRAIMLKAAFDFKCEVFGYNQSFLKRVILKSGKADKIDAMMSMRKRYPNVKIESDDQADALMVLECHIGVRKGVILPPVKKKKKKTRKKK